MTLLCFAELSDDSYGTVVNMTMDQDGSSPHSGVGRPTFLHGGGSPSYLPGHTPPHGHEHFPYADQLSVYTGLGQGPPPSFKFSLSFTYGLVLQVKDRHQEWASLMAFLTVLTPTSATTAVRGATRISPPARTRGWGNRPVPTTDPSKSKHQQHSSLSEVI